MEAARVKPPKSFTLDGRSYDIKVKPLGRFKDGYPVGGRYTGRAVLCSSHEPTDEQRRTVVHEILHAIFDRAGLQPGSHSTPHVEFIITRITGFLLTLLRENPDLVEFLTAPA